MPISVARSLLVAIGVFLFIDDAVAQSIRMYESRDSKLELSPVLTIGDKSLKLVTAVGSGLFRGPGDPAGQFWALSDRGPGLSCNDAKDILEIDGEELCDDPERGRIFLRPDYVPSIFRIALDEAAGTFSVVEQIQLRRSDGRPVSGLSNLLARAATETPLDSSGSRLTYDPGGIDPEALVRLADGTFWVGEENAPSLLHIAPDGRILKRLVPKGQGADLAGAGYPIEEGLPAILTQRQSNRGIEGLALNEEQHFLYAVLQSPLANPTSDTFKRSASLRILKLEQKTGRPVAEFIYMLDPMTGFAGEEHKAQSVARVSELLHLDGERFLVVERTDNITHLVIADLATATNILDSAWDKPSTSPTLEEITTNEARIRPAAKTLVFDSASYPELPTKVEGAALDHETLVLVNDSDFGIEGARTTIIRLEGLPLGP